MVRFRWWSRYLQNLSRLRHKFTGPVWEPTDTLQVKNNDVSLVSTVLALPALEHAKLDVLTPTPQTDANGTTTTKVRSTSPLPPSSLISLPSLASLAPLATHQQHATTATVLKPPRQEKKTRVLPPSDLADAPEQTSEPVRVVTRINVESASRERLAKAPYMVPLDATESSRLDFQHYALRQALGGNYAAPITKPHSILDVGTGTGRWGIELATIFPQASVIGIDIMMPPLQQRPRNFMVVHGNVLDGLPFADASFDFVHQRLLLTSLPTNKLHFVMTELVRVTVPTGWIELVEADIDVYKGGSANKKMMDWVVEASRRCGIDPHLGTRIGDFLHMMRLFAVEVRSISLPLGRWGGRIGRMMAANMMALSQGMKPRMIALMGISSEEYDQTCSQMQYEWEANRCKFTFHVAYGQHS
jgi:SAM-dependent methyltransferase